MTKRENAKGRIYISGAFRTVNPARCSAGEAWIDNDPHFWTRPPTWGICRTDLRKLVKQDDYAFFVLPKCSELGTENQMVYGYICARQDPITHIEAYTRPELKGKRMRRAAPGRPNGNIIVRADGRYNKLDGNEDHRRRFHRIKEYYVIGDERRSRFLKEEEIKRLAPGFPEVLRQVFGDDGRTVFDIVSKWGRVMEEDQVKGLLTWLDDG